MSIILIMLKLYYQTLKQAKPQKIALERKSKPNKTNYSQTNASNCALPLVINGSSFSAILDFSNAVAAPA